MAIRVFNNEVIVQWMEFVSARSEKMMRVLAEKNQDIKKTYNLLKIISKDEKTRMLYEARPAEINDYIKNINSAVNEHNT